jgi:hypothetical protein
MKRTSAQKAKYAAQQKIKRANFSTEEAKIYNEKAVARNALNKSKKKSAKLEMTVEEKEEIKKQRNKLSAQKYRANERNLDPTVFKVKVKEAKRRQRNIKALARKEEDVIEASIVLTQLKSNSASSIRKSTRITSSMSIIDSSFLTFKYVAGRGYGVYAAKPILPATDIAEYGGKVIKSEKKMQELLELGADKLLQIKKKAMWLDGTYSKTLGPWLNHACDCVANCCICFDGDTPIVVSKASELGRIEIESELTFDYGINPDEWPEDARAELEWLRQYKCPVCNKNTSVII